MIYNFKKKTMDGEQRMLKELSIKELANKCQDIKVDGFPLLSYLRYDFRRLYLESQGYKTLNPKSVHNRKAIIGSVVKSFFQIAKLYLKRPQVRYVFNAFPRVESINNKFVDKFTDPIIGLCNLQEDCIILEHSRGGVHQSPRLFEGLIIYSDYLDFRSKVLSHIIYPIWGTIHRKEFENAFRIITSTYGDVMNKKELLFRSCAIRIYTNSFYRLFKALKAEFIIGPARNYQKACFYAANKLGIQTIEMQHGITYGETTMYSGYRDESLMPKLFLAFGDNKPSDVYGIDESRIVNIGWALPELIKSFPPVLHVDEKDVLVISDPEITESMLRAVFQLAGDNTQSRFYIRPHPHETFSKEQLLLIEQSPNVFVQDNKINISVVLQSFTHVIGENSTVLYEALSEGKKVGKLNFEGLHSKYLEESDKECFWSISNSEEFNKFLTESSSSKKTKRIYSPFDIERFKAIIA